MLSLLPGTLCIALTFLVLSAAFTGIGLTVRRAFGLVQVTLDDCFSAFWMGFAGVILFLLLWNFAFRVSGVALGIVLVAGMLGLMGTRGALNSMLVAYRGTLAFWTSIAVLLTGLWMANLASGGMAEWDTALYHMQGVEWARSYAVVPGLANLFGPLGFNNSSLLYDAMLDNGPWAGRAWHVANGLLLFVLATQAVVGGARFLGVRDSRAAADLFVFLLFALLFDVAAVNRSGIDNHASSFSTDVPLTTLRLAATALWYRSLVRDRRDARTEAYDLVCIVVLSAVSVAVKMNAAVFAFAMVVAAAGLWLVRRRPTDGLVGRTLGWAGAAGLAFGSAWMARGVVLSGYPFFPSPALPAPVEWRAPLEHAQAELYYVIHSGRVSANNVPYVSGQITGLHAWFPGWFGRLRDDLYYLPIPVVLTLVMLIALSVVWRRATPDARARACHAWWIVPPTVISLVAWFVVAPDPRYATAGFWTLTALLASQAYLLGGANVNARLVRRVFTAACVLALSPAVVNPLVEWYVAHSIESPAKVIIRANFRIPPDGEWYQRPLGRPILSPYQTLSGLVVNVPEQRCWAGPLPCTPNPAPNLRLRVPGRLDKGFMVDGAWQMINWPEPWRATFLPAWRESRRRAKGTGGG
jgi:hypothetical protein